MGFFIYRQLLFQAKQFQRTFCVKFLLHMDKKRKLKMLFNETNCMEVEKELLFCGTVNWTWICMKIFKGLPRKKIFRILHTKSFYKMYIQYLDYNHKQIMNYIHTFLFVLLYLRFVDQERCSLHLNWIILLNSSDQKRIDINSTFPSIFRYYYKLDTSQIIHHDSGIS